MKTSLKFFMVWMLALLIMAFSSCNKDNLSEAILPETVQGEQGNIGTSGQNGQDGAPGEQGAQGVAGQNGANGDQGPQGEQGAAGADGQDGAAGPAGPTGPQGDTGATGPAGTDGVNGQDGEDGNANVMQFTYEGEDANFYANYSFPVNKEVIETSLILIYVEVFGTWYHIPGIIQNNEYSFSFDSLEDPDNRSTLWITRESGTDDIVFDTMRILIIPANVLTTLKSPSSNLQKMSYQEIMAYFGLAY